MPLQRLSSRENYYYYLSIYIHVSGYQQHLKVHTHHFHYNVECISLQTTKLSNYFGEQGKQHHNQRCRHRNCSKITFDDVGTTVRTSQATSFPEFTISYINFEIIRYTVWWGSGCYQNFFYYPAYTKKRRRKKSLMLMQAESCYFNC